jgi:3-hydroxyisobutyrate dehydrogenase
MGANMARRLKESGFHVTAVYDLRRKQARLLAQELGCEAPTRLSAVTALADVILTVVSDDDSMESLFAQKGDSLLKGAAGKLFINCATVSPATHVMVESRSQAVGAESVEACMASSITQARQGTLYLMTAGQQSSCQRAEPI